jgi:hypothetical protein
MPHLPIWPDADVVDLAAALITLRNYAARARVHMQQLAALQPAAATTDQQRALCRTYYSCKSAGREKVKQVNLLCATAGECC